jgi:hypothetical protein
MRRYVWAAGIVYVVALLAETIVAIDIDLAHDDSAATIARHLDEHRDRLLAIASISIVYALAFTVYLVALHAMARQACGRPTGLLPTFVLVGGVLFVTLHGVSDIAITGLLGSKVASYGGHHDQGVGYALYYLTFALDSVGDVFASLFLFAIGRLILTSGMFPRWLGWGAMLIAALFVVQGFGLGGIVATFGLVVDIVGFLLFLLFVVATSSIMLRREPAPADAQLAG